MVGRTAHALRIVLDSVAHLQKRGQGALDISLTEEVLYVLDVLQAYGQVHWSSKKLASSGVCGRPAYSLLRISVAHAVR